jgi:SWI/SNF-related matrix-associated actin-dependent regulator of chromatin subfamily A3
MLTRLRQLALHPGLIPADYAEQLMKADEEEDPGKAAQEITPDERVRLQALLAQAIEDNEECPVCFDVLDNPRITSCTHRYCYDW